MARTKERPRPQHRGHAVGRMSVPAWLRRIWHGRIRARLRKRLNTDDFDAYVEVNDKRVGNPREWF